MSSAQEVGQRPRMAFVTGASGFFGTHLVRGLVEAGWSVVAFRRASSRTEVLDSLELRQEVGDVRDVEAVVAAMPPRVDAVFHVAGNSSYREEDREEQLRTNVDGTRNVAQAALAAGAGRLIYTSSLIAFGGVEGPVDEDTQSVAEHSRVSYARTKWLAELEVRDTASRGLQSVIFRPASMIGSHDSQGWGRFIIDLARGRTNRVADVTLDFCSPHQAARSHIQAATMEEPSPLYLLGGTRASLLDIATIVNELVGSTPRIKTVPKSLLPPIARVTAWVGRLTRTQSDLTPQFANALMRVPLTESGLAQRELGYRTKPIETMIASAIAWLRDEGLIAPSRA